MALTIRDVCPDDASAICGLLGDLGYPTDAFHRRHGYEERPRRVIKRL